MRLYDRQNRRLYINEAERERFIRAAERTPGEVRTFCLTLLYTGCRISEALELYQSHPGLTLGGFLFRSGCDSK